LCKLKVSDVLGGYHFTQKHDFSHNSRTKHRRLTIPVVKLISPRLSIGSRLRFISSQTGRTFHESDLLIMRYLDQRLRSRKVSDKVWYYSLLWNSLPSRNILSNWRNSES
jgi:hypothetical protein